MSSWLLNLILGRGTPKPPEKPVKMYDPYNDPSLHKVSRLAEYVSEMWKNKRCFSCGKMFSLIDIYGRCDDCEQSFRLAMKNHEKEILQRGLDLRDVTYKEYRLYHIVNEWYDKGEVTQAEAKAYAEKLLAEVKARHEKNMQADLQRRENQVTDNSTRQLSDLI